MPDYVIRIAVPGDKNGIYDCFTLADSLHRDAHPEIFQKASNPKEIEEYLLDCITVEDAVIFVAEDHGVIIGAIIGWIRQTPENPLLVPHFFASIDNLVILEDRRRQGIGQALVERVHLWAKERNLKMVQLTVWDFNKSAQHFYQSIGYKMLHHRMFIDLK